MSTSPKCLSNKENSFFLNRYQQDITKDVRHWLESKCNKGQIRNSGVNNSGIWLCDTNPQVIGKGYLWDKSSKTKDNPIAEVFNSLILEAMLSNVNTNTTKDVDEDAVVVKEDSTQTGGVDDNKKELSENSLKNIRLSIPTYFGCFFVGGVESITFYEYGGRAINSGDWKSTTNLQNLGNLVDKNNRIIPIMDFMKAIACLGSFYGFSHNDLHSNNVLLNKDNQFVMIDLGRAFIIHPRSEYTSCAISHINKYVSHLAGTSFKNKNIYSNIDDKKNFLQDKTPYTECYKSICYPDNPTIEKLNNVKYYFMKMKDGTCRYLNIVFDIAAFCMNIYEHWYNFNKVCNLKNGKNDNTFPIEIEEANNKKSVTLNKWDDSFESFIEKNSTLKTIRFGLKLFYDFIQTTYMKRHEISIPPEKIRVTLVSDHLSVFAMRNTRDIFPISFNFVWRLEDVHILINSANSLSPKSINSPVSFISAHDELNVINDTQGEAPDNKKEKLDKEFSLTEDPFLPFLKEHFKNEDIEEYCPFIETQEIRVDDNMNSIDNMLFPETTQQPSVGGNKGGSSSIFHAPSHGGSILDFVSKRNQNAEISHILNLFKHINQT